MKLIFYKLLQCGYETITFSICCGFIASFFIPIKSFLAFTVAVVLVDTIMGIKAARKKEIPITSRKLYRTTEKIVVYFMAIMIFEGAKNTFSIPIPLTYMISFIIATTELYSIGEKIKIITGVNISVTLNNLVKQNKSK